MLGRVFLSVEGVNIAKTLDVLKQNFEITNINRVHSTKTIFCVRANSCPKIIDYLKQKCYNVCILKFSKIINICVFFRKFWLQTTVFAVCCAVLCILSSLVLGLNFKQNDVLINQQIKQIVLSNNIFGSPKSCVDTKKLEQQILSTVLDVSLLDVGFVGCFLNINYTTKTLPQPTQQQNPGPICSKGEGVVSKIFCVSGTPLVEVGSYVKQGQQLIANYFVDKDGNTVPCDAKGEVFVDVWQSNTIQFCEDTIEYVPTGKEVCASKLLCLGSLIECKTPKIKFKNYLTKVETTKLFDFGVPIYIEITHYLEAIPQKIHQSFLDKQDALKLEAKEQLLGQNNLSEILDEKYTISTVADVFFVTYYAKTEKLVT